ncbi:hypothetical protein MN0502_14940 [Arthrobacter sp. MN05-02]|nr:hypothetical protein MN0502_14940 [Arthrobacter sp. MN05-02]
MGNNPDDTNRRGDPDDREDPADPDDAGTLDDDAALERVTERLREVTEKVEHLTMGIETRDVIGQAKGILMERYDLTGEQAFEVLASVSSTSNLKLRQVALDLVMTRTLPGLPEQ